MILAMDSKLEQLLKERSQSSEGFPHANLSYWSLYESMKSYVHQHFYRSAGAGLAVNGGRYTRHDIEHVNDVIRTAGHLLCLEGDSNVSKASQLNSFEVFVLLTAILLHDAGNAIRRQGHERVALPALRDMGNLSQLTAMEQRLISTIARVHGGTTDDGDKDTIGKVILQPVATVMNNVRVHSRRLAALLRLADELSENPRRADPIALQKPYISKAAVVHNLYCNVINTIIDLPSGTITLEYHLDLSLLKEDYNIDPENDTEVVSLVDYIAHRIDKCEAERIYCGRFLSDFVRYDRLRVRLLVHDDYDELDRIELELSESGYPSHQRRVTQINERFSGVILRRKHCTNEQTGASE
jgi:hypothetical protein